MFEPSGTYRKSISDAEKSGKETEERPGDARDTGDARTWRVANEKPRKFNEHRNEVVNETGCSPANAFTAKIKRKRISRGVQCVSIGDRRSYADRFVLDYIKLKSRRHSLTRKPKRKRANKFDVARNEVNRSSGTTIINDESHKVANEKINDTNTSKDEFEKISEAKVEGNDKELPVIKIQNMHDGEKSKDDSKYRKVKINLLEKLRGALMRKSDLKAQQNGSRHESRNHIEETARLGYENKRVNDARKCGDNSQSVKIVDREMDSSNGRKTITTASADRVNDVNKIKERLDSYIAELNGIIGDAYAIFGNRKKVAKNNGQRC